MSTEQRYRFTGTITLSPLPTAGDRKVVCMHDSKGIVHCDYWAIDEFAKWFEPVTETEGVERDAA